MLRSILLFVILCLLGIFPAVSAEKPNILFLFADDQCFETIGALGLTDIETPNLDRLVEGGTTFTNAYNMGSWSGAVCVASRHMLNTGTFVWQAQKISENIGKKELPNPDWPDFAKENLMWSQLMSSGGYDTYFTGKWHVRADANKIFDVARNVRGGMPKQTEEGYNRPFQGQPDPWSPFDPKFGGFWEGGKHWSEVVADDAIDFLKMAGAEENPYFMYIAFNAPHDPRQAPKSFIDRYPLDRIEVPENFLSEYPYKDQIDNRPSLRDERLAPFPRTKYAVQVHRQEYYAIITHMDEQIGRILDALEASGKRDNTYIFFSADHGLSVGHHGLIGKQNLFEHSTKVPLMVVGPNVEAGKMNPSPVYLQDIMTTSLELGEIKKPDHVKFASLLPVLRGESNGYESIYGGYLKSQRSVTKDGWKLLLYPNVPKALLFDLSNDPLEMNDVFGAHPEKVQSMYAEFLKLQKDTGDTLELNAVFPELSR
ncbi:MAG: sulfatase-like hydrolase/transferase [Verrucomicrobiales bacterium]|nr:sulfatase-like hydrolase/transferase [Verrucomicrobiales bacterium]